MPTELNDAKNNSSYVVFFSTEDEFVLVLKKKGQVSLCGKGKSVHGCLFE